MTRFMFSFGLVAAICTLDALPAHSLPRVFVSAQGADGNPCSFGAPCRTFQHAHDVVDANGEISVLDPAGYGSITITKSISIQGHGFSGITVASGAIGINIVAGPNDAIHLNGLLLEGEGGTGLGGINFITGNNLSIENTVVRGFSQNGLFVGNNGTLPLTVTVSQSYFANNGTNGILLQPNGTGAVTASIDRTVVSGNLFAGINLLGQFSTGGVKATVTDSVAANNKNGSNGAGFLAQSDASHSLAQLVLIRDTAVGNGVGISRLRR